MSRQFYITETNKNLVDKLLNKEELTRKEKRFLAKEAGSKSGHFKKKHLGRIKSGKDIRDTAQIVGD